MNVAVGRLHVMVSLDDHNRSAQPIDTTSPQSEIAERAYRRECMRDAVESDRNRWSRTAALSSRWPG